MKYPEFVILPIYVDEWTQDVINSYGTVFVSSMYPAEILRDTGQRVNKMRTFASILQATALAYCNRSTAAQSLIDLVSCLNDITPKCGFFETTVSDRRLLMHRNDNRLHYVTSPDDVSAALRQYIQSVFTILNLHGLYENGQLRYELCADLVPCFDLYTLPLVDKTVAEQRRELKEGIADAYLSKGPIRTVP